MGSGLVLTHFVRISVNAYKRECVINSKLKTYNCLFSRPLILSLTGLVRGRRGHGGRQAALHR